MLFQHLPREEINPLHKPSLFFSDCALTLYLRYIMALLRMIIFQFGIASSR